MPELPEVERARRLIAETCTGYTIDEVDTVEDRIVYDGADHDEFAKELLGRTVTGCERKGKQFWITLSGEGRYPVMHFGMTGMIQLRGGEPTWYRRKYNLGETVDAWPPRFHKFVMKLSSPEGETRELAFLDPRRLARLRLVPDPVLSHPPLSELGFDPVLSHPTLDEFKTLIGAKKGTVKGVIMDQAFSAGVGNWVADEVLYQARIHPMCPVPALTDDEVANLHRLLREVPVRAVEVNADSTLFPDDWLFRWRWGKGNKKKGKKKIAAKATEAQGTLESFVSTTSVTTNGGESQEKKSKIEFLALPDGGRATIAYLTVGGRTSAIVTELQKMPTGAVIKPKAKRGSKKRKEQEEESSLSELSEEEKPKPKPKTKANAGRATKKRKSQPDLSETELDSPDDEVKPATPSRAERAARRQARA